jgi:phosphoribosyl 1,2-cyclic phosphodiesterase
MSDGVIIRFTILGCGSSGGVPRPALGWGVCDPKNPKNRRRRTSFLVEQQNGAGVTRVLVDTSPDLREQLLDANAIRTSTPTTLMASTTYAACSSIAASAYLFISTSARRR